VTGGEFLDLFFMKDCSMQLVAGRDGNDGSSGTERPCHLCKYVKNSMA